MQINVFFQILIEGERLTIPFIGLETTLKYIQLFEG